MKRSSLICSLLAWTLAAVDGGASAADLTCAGILGNSGQQGPSLVRFGDGNGCRGLGVVCDRFGSLWDRGGAGVLNRYAADGRLLATYPIPRGNRPADQITLVGDRLVLLVDGQLLTLPITAEPNSRPAPLGVQADCISFNAQEQRIAMCRQDVISLLDPADGKAEHRWPTCRA